ncbi:accessory Sec system protein translocase subunit SecY2 [Macrococcus capreoli]|uniref:accessory Sec system protein translocase subunit SecY2 n=1 Tax=Macrococcus capreoli TaxID=2982690 RepID=UPI0021D58914|nr:accessory Sec system protein translocase subunit SecY2 [Macrococcus sp. TMW 2.2395]MCU7558150.1 accessory Sec system protein translocase subunit SecY2 [Macrococcus sp. TMW 2.2395]
MEQKNNSTKQLFLNHIALFRSIVFTSFILLIYIVGSNISLLPASMTQGKLSHFYKMAASNLGGDFTLINIFTLGLGPWLTAMLFISLYHFKNKDVVLKQTKREKDRKEKMLMMIIAIIQAAFVAYNFLPHKSSEILHIALLMLVLIAGSLMLVWLANQNTLYGIAGPMPIVCISVVKSIFKQPMINLHTSTWVYVAILCVMLIIVTCIIYLELSVYKIPYVDLLSITHQFAKPEITWKINPAGSLAVMLSLSVFILLKYIVDFILNILPGKLSRWNVLEFSNPIGITAYIILLFCLSYTLSMLMLNPEAKAKEFRRNGNYFIGVTPGEDTVAFLKHKAHRISIIGSTFVCFIIGIPLFCTLLLPNLYQEIYLAIQIIVLIFIGFNIKETINTYLYFDKYKAFLNKYW